MAEVAPEGARTPPSTGASAARWLNRTVVGIGLASLFSDVGHEMATAAMPALLSSLGSSSLLLGLIEGVSDGAASFAKLASGLYSDRLRRRKPLAIVGYFLTAAGMASFSLASRGWHVFAGRLFGWLGRGARTPVRNVLLTEATSKETYGRAFGLERAMDSAGAVIGPLLALGILHRFGVRSVFAYTLIPGLIAAVLIATLVREQPHTSRRRTSLWSGARALPVGFRRFLVGVGVAGLGDFSNTLLILWATQAWTPRFGAAHAAVLAMAFYVGYNVVYTVSCYVGGGLADRLPKRAVLAGGYALALIPAVALAVPGASFTKFAVAFGVSGLYMGVWETVESSTAATYLPAEVRGLGFGVLATVNGVGDLLSSIVVGALWAVSPVLAMSTVAATSLIGAGLVAGARERDEAAPEEVDDQATSGPTLSVCCATDVGCVRDGNEDASLVADLSADTVIAWDGGRRVPVGAHGLLLAVCDGMGGAAAGEVAAEVATQAIRRAMIRFRSSVPEMSRTATLAAALHEANEAVFAEADRRGERGMGTTCTVALVLPGRLIVAQVGDSRAYLWRDGQLRPLTRDQSLAMAMIEAGTLRPDEVKSFPHSNVILQALGVQEHVAPVVSEADMQPGDLLLLCSDGLHGPVEEGVIAATLARNGTISDRARELIEAALDAGGPDNVTVILAEYRRPS